MEHSAQFTGISMSGQIPFPQTTTRCNLPSPISSFQSLQSNLFKSFAQNRVFRQFVRFDRSPWNLNTRLREVHLLENKQLVCAGDVDKYFVCRIHYPCIIKERKIKEHRQLVLTCVLLFINIRLQAFSNTIIIQ